jgi:hypothetical protein
MHDNEWLRYSHSVHFSDNRQHYVLYTENGKILSFLLYREEDYSFFTHAPKKANIIAAWTDLNHRRKGLYNDLFEELKKIAKKKNYDSIDGGYHRKNVVSGAMQKSQNRDIFDNGGSFISTSYSMRPKSEVNVS